jgi:hypothetical protein
MERFSGPTRRQLKREDTAGPEWELRGYVHSKTISPKCCTEAVRPRRVRRRICKTTLRPGIGRATRDEPADERSDERSCDSAHECSRWGLQCVTRRVASGEWSPGEAAD